MAEANIQPNDPETPKPLPGLPSLSMQGLPEPVRAALLRIADAGYSTRLVGECVLDLLLGRRPAHFEAESTIAPDDLLEREANAVPSGVRSGRVSIPTSAGPIDLLPGSPPASRPAHFQLLEFALDPHDDCVLAPEVARRDFLEGRLTPTSHAGSSRDPAFALEAARLIARYGLTPSPEAFACARNIPFSVPARARQSMRRLLRETLLAPHACRGLRWLRDSGVEAQMVTGVRHDAAEFVSDVPPRAALRLAAWLVDADARGLLRRLHFGGEVSARVYRLIQWHPIDRHLEGKRSTALRKWSTKTNQGEIDDSVALAAGEADRLAAAGNAAAAQGVRARLTRLHTSLARLREADAERRTRPKIALTGADVVAHLGCAPGPQVGRALAHLEQKVRDEPAYNEPSSLRALLDDWACVETCEP